jgi:hypothetical protein
MSKIDYEPYCAGCHEPCKIVWRRDNVSFRRWFWAFMSDCCEAVVVNSRGRALDVDEVENDPRY